MAKKDEVGMTQDQITNEINQCNNILQQHDYAGRKVAFENARVIEQIIQHLGLDIAQPVYNKYKDVEAEADQLRLRIDELREMTPDDEQ